MVLADGRKEDVEAQAGWVRLTGQQCGKGFAATRNAGYDNSTLIGRPSEISFVWAPSESPASASSRASSRMGSHAEASHAHMAQLTFALAITQEEPLHSQV